ncbi:MAG TPA: glycosyltransferase family 4 protein [Bryobacteraceae bacterium]|nr:glycosyltransferase family 4 protein [Bryobacteraceae bacterium]
MRILHLITRAELGGAQTHVIDLLAAIREYCDITVGTGERGFLTEELDSLGISYEIVPHLVQPMSPFEDVRALGEIVALIGRTLPDVVHAHTSKAGILGRLAARCAGVPAVFTAHTWCFSEGTSLKWKMIGVPMEKLAGRCSAAIINVSEANRKLALSRRVAPREKLLTVHNGIPDVLARATPGRGDVPVIAMLARFAEQKNQALLVRAIAGIPEPLRVLFVGDGPTRSHVEALARSLHVDGRCVFAGQRLDVPAILAGAHVFALSTNWEGFPVSILEAMRAGLPVIASDVGGVRESVIDGQTGFVVPPGDEGELRHRVRQLIESPALRCVMGAAGRRRFEQNFTVRAMADKVLRVYEAVGARAPQPEYAIAARR